MATTSHAGLFELYLCIRYRFVEEFDYVTRYSTDQYLNLRTVHVVLIILLT
jgi:hypothetical protein